MSELNDNVDTLTAEGEEETFAPEIIEDTDTDAQDEEAVGTDEASDTIENFEYESEESEKTDYAELEKEDVAALRREFYEAKDLVSLTELDNPKRFAELRDLGLTAREAYLATQRVKRRSDNRSHLRGSAPTRAGGSIGEISRAELQSAREIFVGMSDSEIRSLYRKVSK